MGEEWERETGAPNMCARSWRKLTDLFDDVADGVRVRVEFRTEVFGREVFLWGDFCGFDIGADGTVCAHVLPSADDDGLSETVPVPLLSVTDWTVE